MKSCVMTYIWILAGFVGFSGFEFWCFWCGFSGFCVDLLCELVVLALPEGNFWMFGCVFFRGLLFLVPKFLL